MGAFDIGLGNKPINSTGAVVSAPSTETLLAELDSTQLGTVNFRIGQRQLFRVSWIVGSDTSATWQLESAASTALASGVDVFFPKTAPSQSAQYVTTHELTKDMRLRARLASTAVNSAAFISAEPVG